MAIIHKIMKTFTRPDGNDKVQYEIVDRAGRKMIAPDWYEHEDEAFTAGQHIVKDGILYRFLIPHTAETEWNSNEVTAVNVGEEIEAIVISLNGKIPTTAKGVANGVAELDSTGKVPAAQLPSYVDDVQEYSDKDHFPVTGSTGVIYVAIDTNKTYRWSGSAYVEISESLALGETSSTAFRGDHGKTAYDHATDANRLTTAQAEGLYKVSVSDEGHVKSVTAVQKEDITNLGIPAQDTTYSPATQSSNGLMSSQDKTKLDGIDMSSKVNTSDFYATEMPVSETDSTKVATALSDVKSQIDGKADLIRDTVQNVAIASVPDAASNLPLSALRFAVESIQSGSGDPYPAGGGKNKFPQQTVSGTQSVAVNNLDFQAGIYSFSAVATSDDTDDTSCAVIFFNGSTQVKKIAIARGTRKTALLEFESAVDNAIFYAATTNAKSAGDTLSFDGIQIESGSTATAYAPYSNIRPITGRTGAVVSGTGVNAWDEEWEVGNYDSTTGQKNAVNNQIRSKNFIPVKPSTTYYFKSNSNSRVLFYGLDKSYLGSDLYNNATFTTPANCYFVNFHLGTAYGTTYKDDVTINYPSTDTAYNAYTGTQHTVQFGSTVYGGEVDWVGAECADGAEYVTFDGSETWRDNSGNGYFTIINNRFDLDKMPVFDYVKALERGCGATLGTWQGRLNQASTNKALLVKPDMTIYDTKEKWAEYLTQHPLHVVLWLVTPTTIPLTDLDEINTVEGQMNLWCDSGDIELMEYPCDTKLYVEKRLSASQNLMELIVTANREDGMKATKAYSTGNLLIVNGTLYRATTSIANGATLTPGTNVTATTVAAELAALA